jgi:hypothetical protein
MYLAYCSDYVYLKLSRQDIFKFNILWILNISIQD